MKQTKIDKLYILRKQAHVRAYEDETLFKKSYKAGIEDTMRQKVDIAYAIREKNTTEIWNRLVPPYRGKTAFMLHLIFSYKKEAENFIKNECLPREQKVLEVIEVSIISKIK